MSMNTSKPGFPKWLISLAVVLLVSAIVYYLNSSGTLEFKKPQTSQTQPATDSSQATAANPTTSAPSPIAGAPTSAPSPKGGPVDLTPDANGLSKATVKMETTKGVIKYKFYPNEAPETSKRTVELIQNGFYSGITFHRVVPNFVIQAGDPTGTGAGGSGKNQKAEFSSRKHVEGTVAMARKANDVDSADSQFYIVTTTRPLVDLDGHYTIFGQVIEGMDVAKKMQVGDKIVSMSID